MPTRERVLAMVDAGLSYADIGRRLGIEAGLAYLIATGLPADGSDTLTSQDRDRPGFLAGSTQHLANEPPLESPKSSDTVLAWVRQRVETDAQMLRAAAQRDLEPPPVQDPDDDHDLVTVLTRQHNQVAALIQQLSATPGHKKGGTTAQIVRRQTIAGIVAVRLAEHESAEERHLWPAVREQLADGDSWAERGHQQEQEMRETLAGLPSADPASDEFDDLVDQLALRVRQHVALEDRLFLLLKDQLPSNRREQLGRDVEAEAAGNGGRQR
jgi:hypothetical protein